MRATHNLTQGSSDWHQHRQSHFNASDAPAMMGASKYRSRTDLLREKATGITPEVAEATQRLFDAGHAAEAAIRPVIELAISEELYAVTMSVNIDGLRLSASLDGLNFDGDTILEVKLWNEELAEQVRAGELDPHYYWQLEQQLLCSGATRVIFATGDGAEKLATMEYRAVPGRADELIAGWRQFAADLASYSHVEKQERQVTGRTPETLPALRIEARGMVTSSNLNEFKSHALEVLGKINRDLQTDDDFADAEATVKWCKGVEDRLEATKASVLGQMADVDAVCRTLDDVAAETRRIRLDLDKLVKAEKDARKAEIVRAGVLAVQKHYVEINTTMGEHAISPPTSLSFDIANTIKGLKTLSSIRDKISTAVAGAKIDVSERAERVRKNIATLASLRDDLRTSLFPDRVQLCATKDPEDLRNLFKARIAEHDRREEERERARQKQEAERLEQQREQIRQEELARIERERSEAAQLAAVTPEPAIVAPPTTPAPTPTDIAEDGHKGTGFRYTPVRPPVRLKLGDINAAIAPLSITADGLARLGFHPVATDRASRLYEAATFEQIRAALLKVLTSARAEASQAAA